MFYISLPAFKATKGQISAINRNNPFLPFFFLTFSTSCLRHFFTHTIAKKITFTVYLFFSAKLNKISFKYIKKDYFTISDDLILLCLAFTIFHKYTWNRKKKKLKKKNENKKYSVVAWPWRKLFDRLIHEMKSDNYDGNRIRRFWLFRFLETNEFVTWTFSMYGYFFFFYFIFLLILSFSICFPPFCLSFSNSEKFGKKNKINKLEDTLFWLSFSILFS